MFKLHQIQYKDILKIHQLTIPAKQITCIVGESGSGKTTLLRMLNKLISPDEGTLRYLDTPLDEISSIELRRRVTMLPQAPAIFPGTLRDNLLIGLKFSEKQLVSDEELRKVLSMINLSKELDQNAEKLSGGEKQRLALGRVLILDPEVFLLDEPSSALDEETEELITDRLVAHCKKANKALVMVTHSKRIANNYGDTIIELKNGEIINQEGV